MRGVAALASARFEIASLPQPAEQQVKEEQVLLPAEQALPKLDQHRVIKAGVAQFQSSRPRTASAACRSDKPSRNCSTLTRASLQGVSAGCPRCGKRSANCSSS